MQPPLPPNPEHAHIEAHDEINSAFQTWSVLTASRKQLERWLVTLCTVKMGHPENAERNRSRADAIKLLLQIRITEKLHFRSLLISIAALLISILALVISYANYHR